MSINNDTLYSIAQLDVSGGPLRLRVPDTAGRYYVLQFVDAWTNNFAYVGRRATGTAAGIASCSSRRDGTAPPRRGTSDRVPDDGGHDRRPLGLRRARPTCQRSTRCRAS